mgnify:CR=1 FL=1
MRITRIIASSLSGVLLIIGACVPLRTVSNEIGPLNEVTPDVAANLTQATVLATFATSDLKVTYTTYVGEDAIARAVIKAIVKVTNTGAQTATSKVELKVDGATVKTQDVTLAGGASQERSFELSYDKAGKYMFTIDKLSYELTVAF